MLLVSGLGVGEDAAPVDDDGELLDDDEDGGVVELELDELDGGVVGDIVELDDELDGGDGVVDDEDVDGDGVTTGGVVDVVDDSRLQPATPSTKPVQSSVINTRFIEDLQIGCERVAPRRFSRFDAMEIPLARNRTDRNRQQNQWCRRSATLDFGNEKGRRAHIRRAIFIGVR